MANIPNSLPENFPDDLPSNFPNKDDYYLYDSIPMTEDQKREYQKQVSEDKEFHRKSMVFQQKKFENELALDDLRKREIESRIQINKKIAETYSESLQVLKDLVVIKNRTIFGSLRRWILGK